MRKSCLLFLLLSLVSVLLCQVAWAQEQGSSPILRVLTLKYANPETISALFGGSAVISNPGIESVLGHRNVGGKSQGGNSADSAGNYSLSSGKPTDSSGGLTLGEPTLNDDGVLVRKVETPGYGAIAVMVSPLEESLGVDNQD